MKTPDIPANEPSRLRLLRAYQILDSAAEAAYDELTELAATIAGVPIALVSLIDEERQWFKSSHGLDATETERALSFCGHVVASGQAMIVENALRDERFFDNPFVTGDPNVRFYAGMPLKVESGETLGTLCVIDDQPGLLSDSQVRQLRIIANQIMRLMTMRLIAEEQRQARNEITAFFDLNIDLLCVANTQGYFTRLNPAWTSALGWSEVELCARPVFSFVHPDDRERTAAELAELSPGKPCYGLESRFRTKSGGYRWLRWMSVMSEDRSRMFSVAHDITDQKTVEEMKSEFVSTVSHELRTPLTSVSGSLRLLENGVCGELPGSAQQLVKVASQNCQRLIRLINDLLDLDKIESGKLELNLEAVDLQAILEQSMQSIEAMARDAEVALAFHSIPADSLGRAALDADRITQVAVNLLSNAIKFSPRGGTVTVCARASADRIRVEVSDQGPGIRTSDIERLFGRFIQLDSGDARKQGGTGLGLAICKAIVAQHHGQIGVESEIGSGTTFWFEIPRGAIADHDAAAPTNGSTRAADRSFESWPYVLIVATDPNAARTLSELVEAEGYRAGVAPSLEAAQDGLHDHVPSACLVDTALLDGSGVEFVRELRRSLQTRNVPVIAMCDSMAPDTESVDPVLLDWMQKPVDTSRLRQALRRATDHGERPNVLLIEDDPASATVLRTQIELMGAECQWVSQGMDAIASAREQAPDLIILDIGLPDVDGFEVVRVLRELGIDSTPLLVYTGRDLTQADRSTLHLGQTRHLTKTRTDEAGFQRALRELLHGVLRDRAQGAKLASSVG